MDELFPTARDLMTQNYLVVRPSLGLLDAVVRLEHFPEDTAFVVDEQGCLMGLLTEKECLRVLAARAYDEALAETVADVMAPTPVALSPTTDAYAIAQAFLRCSCGVLPVVDQGRIVGGVWQLAALRAFLAVFQHRTAARRAAERTAADLEARPEAIERMQRVFSALDPHQLVTLLRRRR